MNIHDLFVPFDDELQLLPSKRDQNPPLIEWKSAFGDLFFRLKDAEPEILWCDLGYTVTPKRPLPPARRATLAKRVSRVFNGRTFFRVVPFDEDKDWVLVRPKRALVKSPNQQAGAHWEWKADFALEDETQFHWLSQSPDWFQMWLSAFESNKNLVEAREIAAMNDEERQWSIVVAPREVRQNWEQLARALHVLATSPEKTPEVWRASRWQPDGKSYYLSLEPEPNFQVMTDKRLTAPVLKLRGELTTHFQLRIDFRRWRGLEPNGTRRSHSFPRFELASVSQHERLEAALLWRDFAREIGKTDEIEALLRELMKSE